MKAKKAEEFGVEFEKFPITNLNNQKKIKSQILKFNRDEDVDGIIIQMPLGTKNDPELIGQIDLNKDVDGMRRESGVMPATVRAVIEILNFAKSFVGGKQILNSKYNTLVVGNKGLVGARIQEELNCEGMDKDDFDPKKLMTADAIISATGVASLINGQMVKDGVICIDVGYPKGDFDPSTALKAGFFTPVPGGVGPVTVVSLFANLVELL
jgi:methylenetetrahydrofolate dehydrogenase (NADP+)/methenyltetrahydrofolate cyclohydrolase